jgi:flagellar hook-basal body complex protein FliE
MDITSALRAYAAAPKAGTSPSMPQPVAQPGFSEMIAGTIEDTLKATRQGEQALAAGASGKAELVDVVTAVANAETTLETMVALRDRVISAYQEIMRMPI